MNDIEFIQQIESRTGKLLGKDFGLIAGTQSPYSEKAGFMTAGLINGFSVWKRTPEGHTMQDIMQSEGAEKNIEKIVNFLNEDL